MSFQRVVALDEIRDGEIYPAHVEGVDVIVVRFEGGVAAYLDACPHEGAQLSFGSREGDVLVCAKHLWEFDVRSGEHISRVRRPQHDLKKVPLRVVEGEVEVDVAGLA
ncbi:MAG TPA: Rieske 2Fe-2S domain-containing protein [Burkholderiales bacterium]|nr:Rieske 2Fe-2S domain-containing protein [Burkholderiales bacterium]